MSVHRSAGEQHEDEQDKDKQKTGSGSVSPKFCFVQSDFFFSLVSIKKLLCMELVPSNSEKMTFHPKKYGNWTKYTLYKECTPSFQPVFLFFGDVCDIVSVPVPHQHLLEHARSSVVSDYVHPRKRIKIICLKPSYF